MPHRNLKYLLTYLVVTLLMGCEVDNQNGAVESHRDILDGETNKPLIYNSGIDTLLNSDLFLVLGGQPTEILMVDTDKVDNYPGYKFLMYHRGQVLIGKQTEASEVELFVKYNPRYSFSDFKVEEYIGKLANPNFESNPDAFSFRTRIRNGCKDEGVNFAGHFTIISWGCGSNCAKGAVVDRINGVIYDLPYASWGYEYKTNSELLIINYAAVDTLTNLIQPCAWCEVSLEHWNGKEFVNLE